MKKHEAEFCSKLGKWWVNVGHGMLPIFNYKIEAKISTGTKPFNFKSGIKPHQTPTLIQYNTKPMYWKISDLDTISTKHYDMCWDNHNVTVAVFVFHWVRAGNKKFYIIRPEAIQGLIDTGFKSLTEDMASQNALYELFL